MIPLIVTAELTTAWTAADPWSPSLDGILAYWALREQLGEEEFALGMTGARPLVDAALPLGREDGPDGWWWWQCSSPLAGVAATFARHSHRRFDDQHALDRVPETIRKVLTTGGPYKAYRNQRTMRVSRAMTWHCIGDAGEIERLLRRCANIGGGYGRGYGQVARWRVEAGGDVALARFHRPLPVAFAAAHGVSGMPLEWGVRPPGRARRTLCVMPPPAA